MASADGTNWIDLSSQGWDADFEEWGSSGGTSVQHTLTINISGQGSVAQNPNQTTYSDGTNVILTATPASGWTFSGWSGSLTGTTNPVTITMNSDKTITATFTVSSSLTRYENYTTANAIDIFYGTNVKGQTFTPQVTHTLTKVRLPLLKQGNPGGSVLVNIYATDASGLPAGSALAYGSILCSDIAASWTETWYDISLGTGCQVQAGVKYAIIFSAPSADANNPLYYWVNTNDGYSGGWVVGSSGTAWFSISSQGWDADFEEWGQ